MKALLLAALLATPAFATVPTTQEVVIYLADDEGRTAAAIGTVLGADFVGCFARWEDLPAVRCYRLTGATGAVPSIKITEAVETSLIVETGT